MRKLLSILSASLFMAVLSTPPAVAENLTVNGDMGSDIHFEIRKVVELTPSIRKLILSFVIPPSFDSPTSNQSVQKLALKFTPEPQDKKSESDGLGNTVVTATWTVMARSIEASLGFTAENRTALKQIDSGASFPLTNMAEDVRYYLKSTEQVQSDDPRIRKLASELTEGVVSEFDAVQRILSYVVDNMKYVTPPARYDALYSFDSKKGNCQNYSHLSAALMRAVNIPVRIVNGITLNRPFDVNRKGSVFTFKFGQGRHSWVEVWFPDLGWVPIDPQQTAMFVPNRFIRIEVGIDNNQTKNDGMMKWAQVKGSDDEPRDTEIINADFVSDSVKIAGRSENYGPKNILLIPEVKSVFQKKEIVPPEPIPVLTAEDKAKLHYTVPFLYGNLEFPENIDFAFPPSPKGEKKGEKTKSFYVETAEYVTTKATQYAQVFILTKPVKIKKIGLALHKFGGDGQIWVDLFQDRAGKPGDVIATSSMTDVENISPQPGYRWQDFTFTEDVILMPGAYWIGLGFTGSPIINWFYTYGKTVGPVEGTRYKGVFEQDWSGALSYEFNYRVTGLTVGELAQAKQPQQKSPKNKGR